MIQTEKCSDPESGRLSPESTVQATHLTLGCTLTMTMWQCSGQGSGNGRGRRPPCRNRAATFDTKRIPLAPLPQVQDPQTEQKSRRRDMDWPRHFGLWILIPGGLSWCQGAEGGCLSGFLLQGARGWFSSGVVPLWACIRGIVLFRISFMCPTAMVFGKPSIVPHLAQGLFRLLDCSPSDFCSLVWTVSTGRGLAPVRDICTGSWILSARVRSRHPLLQARLNRPRQRHADR